MLGLLRDEWLDLALLPASDKSQCVTLCISTVVCKSNLLSAGRCIARRCIICTVRPSGASCLLQIHSEDAARQELPV